jgi:uncharacterized protein YueI
MNNNINYFYSTEEIDQEWVKEIAKYSSIVNNALSEKDKKLLIKLFIDYKSEGFNSLSAMKKAILVFDNFRS